MLLRGAEPRDLPAFEARADDPEILRWIGPSKVAPEEVLRRDEDEWATKGSPTLMICALDGTAVGKIWLDLDEGDKSSGEIGYWLLPAGRGRGLATIAVGLLVEWATNELGIVKLRIQTDPDNERSQRVAERNGFRRAGMTATGRPDHPDHKEVIFER